MHKLTNTLSPSPKGFQSPKFSDSDSDVRKALVDCTTKVNSNFASSFYFRQVPLGLGRAFVIKITDVVYHQLQLNNKNGFICQKHNGGVGKGQKFFVWLSSVLILR
jgi:hypothetical protein